MKLWYTLSELQEARKEVESLICFINSDIGVYFTGNVEIRMAWREDTRSRESIPLSEWKAYGESAIRVYIPEAELLINGELVRKDLLELICIDMLRLELNALANERNHG